MRKARVNGWLVLLLGVAGLVLLAILAILLTSPKAALDEAWKASVYEHDRRENAGFDRPAILEPAQAGDVVDAYEGAFQLFLAAPEPLRRAAQGGFPLGAPVPREGLEGSFGDVVEAVRDGLRRTRHRFDLNLRKGLGSWVDPRERRLPLVAALWLEVDLASLRGRDADALRVWVAALGYGADDLRGIDPYWVNHRLDYASHAALVLDGLLAAHAIPATELRETLRAVERIEAAWPSYEEAGRIHFLLCRTSVVLGEVAALSAREPSARHLWSEGRRDVALLAVLDREEQDYLGIFGLPAARRKEEAKRLDAEYRDADLPARPRNWHFLEMYVDTEYRTRASLGLIKTALAVAWHEAETGRPPDRLEELVPARLAALPLDARSGKPFGYAHGKVWWVGSDGDDDGGRAILPDATNDDGDVVIRIRRR